MAQRVLRDVAEASQRAELAHDLLRKAILEARESGETLTDIAKAARLPRHRISRIVACH